jgi:hypothetical protein
MQIPSVITALPMVARVTQRISGGQRFVPPASMFTTIYPVRVGLARLI